MKESNQYYHRTSGIKQATRVWFPKLGFQYR